MYRNHQLLDKACDSVPGKGFFLQGSMKLQCAVMCRIYIMSQNELQSRAASVGSIAE